MIDKTTVKLAVNGTPSDVAVEPRRILADVLRDRFGLRSVHLGCEQGACGGCTVLIDGEPAASCLMLAVQAEGRAVTTLEGLLDDERMRLLQEAFHEHYALQCGYCIPGVLVNLFSFLAGDRPATEERVRARLSGNLCRCTGYQNMVAAAVAASSGRISPDPGLEQLTGVGANLAAALRSHGFTTIRDVAAAPEAALVDVPGVGRVVAQRLIAAARAAVSAPGSGDD